MEVQTSASVSYAPMAFGVLLFALMFAYVWTLLRSGRQAPAAALSARTAWVAVAAAALLMRCFFAVQAVGYETDVGLFKAWAQQAYSEGLSGFYSEGMFADYPPGYVYILYVLGAVRKLFSFAPESAAYTFLIKLPAMLADIAVGRLIYRLSLTRFPPYSAVAIAALYLLNPAAVLNSSSWGQIDAVFMLVVLIALELLVRGRLPAAAAVFALAALIKPQGLLFGLLLLLAVIRRGSWKAAGQCAGMGVLVAALLSFPFIREKPGGFAWLLDLYAGTLSQYPYASLNAFNFYALLGGNWQPVSGTFLAIPFPVWSALFLAAGAVYCAFVYFKSDEDEAAKLYVIGHVFLVLVFMFAVKMHERYLFYGWLLGLASFIRTKDRRFLLLFAGFSVTHWINVHTVLVNSWVENFFLYREQWLVRSVSLANVLLFAGTVKTGWDRLCKGKAFPLRHERRNKRKTAAAAPSLPWDMRNMSVRDFIPIAVLTAGYAGIALANLGELRAPETYWQPQAGDRVVVDLGTRQYVDRINSFAATGDGTFEVRLSEDGTNWGEARAIERNGGNVFAWDSLPVEQPARYIRIDTVAAGARLNELAVFGEDRKRLPIASVEMPTGIASADGVRHLFDEQDEAAYRTTHLNSTYFDEIYHARTAYEHAQRLEPYETTHPPLGKLLIAAGAALFGMNPFGWRIAGASFGIMMIPLMYVLARRMFGRAEYGLIAAFLLAFDFMHFVQTRIAVVDGFAVFFIMLMFYFMYRYCTMNFYRDGLQRTWAPLGWCGLFFGLGAAVKWISLYAGAGLAVLFLISLAERYAEYRKDNVRLNAFPRYAAATIGFCLLSFVLVPAIVYAASYIPFMMVDGPGHGLADVIRNQKHMIDYHSTLKAEHPFQSDWHEWPTMVKPVWYYGGQGLEGDRVSLIVALGNPAVWGWIGIASIAAAMWLGWKRKDRRALFLAVALGSVYVPWMLVPRLTFIYHFFAAVPMVILCITYVIMHLHETKPSRWIKLAVRGYLAAVLLLFVLFYPILSGLAVEREFVDTFLKWRQSWQF